MFPTSGYFRGVNCPFFINGLCERANCHFRHSKPVEKTKENGPNYSTATRTYSQSLPSLGYNATSSLQSAKESNSVEEENATHSTIPNLPSSSTDSGVCSIPSFTDKQQSFPESSEPSASDKQNLPRISGLSRPKSTTLPSYKPTPKAQPEPASTSSNGEVPHYKPTPKDWLSGEKTKPSRKVLEYDPVKNFAFPTKQNTSSDSDGYDEEAPSADAHHNVAGANVEVEAKFSDEDEPDLENERNCVESKASGSETNDIIHDTAITAKEVPDYAELLTPSSYFTSKISSISSKEDTSSFTKGDSHSKSCEEKSSKGSGHEKKASKSHKSNSSSQHRKSVEKSRSSSVEKSKSSSVEKSKSSSVEKSRSSSVEKSKSSSVEKSRSSSDEKSKSSSKLTSSTSLKSSSKHASSKKESHNSVLSSTSKHRSSLSSVSSIKESKVQEQKNVSSSHKDAQTGSKDSHKEKNSHREDGNSKDGASHRKSSTDQSNHSSQEKDKSHHISNSSPSHIDSKHQSPSSSSSSHSSSHPKAAKKSHSSLSRSSSSEAKHSTEIKEKIKKEDVKKASESTKDPCSSRSSSSEIRNSLGIKEIIKKEDMRKHYESSKDKNSSETHKTRLKSETKRKDHRNHSLHGEGSIKHEKQRGISKSPKNIFTKIEQEKVETQSIISRRVSDITWDLFGNDTDGSDSDVQIVEEPSKPPPIVYEVYDSEEEVDNHDNKSDSELLEDESFSFSDSDTFDECLRIFQESEKSASLKTPNSDNLKKLQQPKQLPNRDTTLTSLGKKRMAYEAADKVKRPFKPAASTRSKLSPAEVMHNRILDMQKRALLRAAKREGREAEVPQGITNKKSSVAASASSLMSSQKKREAHFLSTPVKRPATDSNPSNSSSMSPGSFYSKKRKTEDPPQSSTNFTSKKPAASTGNKTVKSTTVTISGTASKTEKRQAHVSAMSNLKRPIIPVEFGNKVPTNIRQRYLNLMIDEYLKFCNDTISFTKGQEEEKEVYTRATNKNIYLRLAVNKIKKIRTEAMEAIPSSSKNAKKSYSLSQVAAQPSPVQSHAATLGGSRAAKTSFTLNRSGGTYKEQPLSFKGADFYARLKRYILTEEQMRENGFPRPSEDGSSKAAIFRKEETDTSLKEHERSCRRCGKRYTVAKDGTPVAMEHCVYHYGKAYKKKVAGSIDARHSCCNERSGAKGCEVAKTHVNERNKLEDMTGYMKTMPADVSDPKNEKVYAMDCEMVYTKAGLELARVTVIGENSEVVYESLVKPETEVLDYNTRFSGITESAIKGVTTSLIGVQAVLLSMISDKTILIGHSLESDFLALKLMHNTVVDTSIVFPHRLGLPYKRALRNLTVEHLQKIIQDDAGGHDSSEDAASCMQLMLYKVKEDAKREKRVF